jgi:hypothetical protein
MTRDEVMRRLHSAYDAMITDDLTLFEVDANERSLTHKLAEHLQSEFPDWDVDCEYNRDGHDKKRLSWSATNVRTDDTDGKTVFPDVIVHHRMSDDNLIVIEAKKSTTFAMDDDERKLEAYKSQLDYQFAIAVVFPVGAKASDANSAKDITEVGDESDQ